MDGANVEMAEEMGEENMFIFGMSVDEVEALKCSGYNAEDYVNSNAELAEVMEQLKSGYFSGGNGSEFQDIVDNLLKHDRFFTLADYEAYILAQEKVNETYRVSFDKFRVRSFVKPNILNVVNKSIQSIVNFLLLHRTLLCGQRCLF